MLCDHFPSISVIIPTYYRHDVLNNLLNSLSEQTVKPIDVIVVDQTPLRDRPPDFYKPHFGRLPLIVIDISTPSSTKARNIGAKRARGETLCFLDDKVICDQYLLQRHLEVMGKEHVDVVHGAVLINKEIIPKSPSWESLIPKMDPVHIFMISMNCQWQCMTLGVAAGNFSIRREVFFKINGFDECMSGRYDDIDFAYRLFRSGAKMYFSPEPAIKAKRLYYGGSRASPVTKFDRHLSPVPHPNYLYFHLKHFPGWTTKQLILKLLFEVYKPSLQWLRHPWRLALTPIRIIRSMRISRKMLQQNNLLNSERRKPKCMP